MKKIIFFFVFLGSLIIPAFAFADWTNPVNPTWFPIHFHATWQEENIPVGAVNAFIVWEVQGGDNCDSVSFESDGADVPVLFSPEGLEADWIFALSDNPDSSYYIIPAWLDCWKANKVNAIANVGFLDENNAQLEGWIGADYNFTLSDIPAYNIVPLELDFTSKVLKYPKNLASNIGDLIYIIIGLPLAFWSVGKIIKLVA